MFRRGKDKTRERIDRSRNAEPDAEPDDALDDALDRAAAGEDEDEEDEPLEAGFSEDEDEEDDEAETQIARRQIELQAELDREAEEFGLAGVDTAATYGPNGEQVVEVLDKLEGIDVDDAERLADAWLAVDPAERDVVERDLRRRHRDGNRAYELTAAEDAVSNWLSRKLAAEPDDAELWRIVAAAARGAVDALVLDEDLDDVDYETLHGAWAEWMESGDAAEDDAGEDEPGSAGGGPGTAETAGTGETADTGEFGPNGELVAQLIEKVRSITTEQALRLAERFREQPKGDLRQAHDAVKDVVSEDRTWRTQVKTAQDAVADLLTASLVHRATTRTDVMEKERAARQAAMPGAVDAVTALVLADLLEPEDAVTLFGPWADVIGEPDLPAFEDD